MDIEIVARIGEQLYSVQINPGQTGVVIDAFTHTIRTGRFTTVKDLLDDIVISQHDGSSPDRFVYPLNEMEMLAGPVPLCPLVGA